MAFEGGGAGAIAVAVRLEAAECAVGSTQMKDTAYWQVKNGSVKCKMGLEIAGESGRTGGLLI